MPTQFYGSYMSHEESGVARVSICVGFPNAAYPHSACQFLVVRQLMGKTRHQKSNLLIRHVRYTTKNSSRGPKLVRHQVKEATFRSSPSKARSSSQTHRDPSYDNNNDSYQGYSGMGGKVLLIYTPLEQS